ncbi:TPA: hypothetical protein N0F65_010947 [Lagenidium giganteum]|uniref:SWIM-type domain-containing protein n=1 Tax=Lagenidium giganteum TaxID=4803 RepID=A0AAV2YXH8_9STRA|nr:TPA: hypothetical protein N0F65_010947 [Lagenidium giganteum]
MLLDMSISALLAFQNNIERRIDDEMKEVAGWVSDFVCELIKTQYDLARANKYKYNSLPPFVIIQYDDAAQRESQRQVSSELFGTDPDEEDVPQMFEINPKTWMRSCSFSATYLLPCRHAIYATEGLRAGEKGMIHKRWQLRHLKKQALQDAMAAVNSVSADASDGNNSFSVRHIHEAIAPRNDEYKTARQLTDKIADVVADQGINAYQSILLASTDFKVLVCNAKVPQVFEHGPDATCPELEMDSIETFIENTVEVCEREDGVARGEEQAVAAERAESVSSASSECEYQIPQFESPRPRRVVRPRKDKPRAKSKQSSKVDNEADTKSLVPLAVVEAGMKALRTYTW